MHNSESILENETHKLLWDFKIKTDHLISVRRPDLVIIKKKKKKREEKTCHKVDFAVSVDHRGKIKENTKRYKYLDLARKLRIKKTMEHESVDDTNCAGCTLDNSLKIGKGT